jgi:hypothetical protein
MEFILILRRVDSKVCLYILLDVLSNIYTWI